MSDAAPTTRISDLSAKQRRALGHLAHRPWGCHPRHPTTWKSLRARSLVQMGGGRPGERGLFLTEQGKALVERLDPLMNRPATR